MGKMLLFCICASEHFIFFILLFTAALIGGPVCSKPIFEGAPSFAESDLLLRLQNNVHVFPSSFGLSPLLRLSV